MQGEFVNFRWIAVNQFSLEKRHSFYSFTHLLLLNLFQANPSSHQRRAGHTLDKSSLHHRATFTPWGDLHWTMNLTNSHTHIHRKLHSTTTVHSATAHLFYLLCKSNVVYLYASDLVCGADIFTVLRYVCWTFDPILWLSPLESPWTGMLRRIIVSAGLKWKCSDWRVFLQLLSKLKQLQFSLKCNQSREFDFVRLHSYSTQWI